MRAQGGRGIQAGCATPQRSRWPNCRQSEKEAYRARVEKGWNREPSSMPRVTAELRRGLPDNVVIVDESITASLDLARAFDYRGFGDYFGGRGGGIGQGLAGAIGVKVAMPDRPVVAVSGDGSAMYSDPGAVDRRAPQARDRVRGAGEPRVSHPQAQCRCLASELRSRHPASLSEDGHRPAQRSTSCISRPAWASRRQGREGRRHRRRMAKAVAADRPYLVEIAIEGKR